MESNSSETQRRRRKRHLRVCRPQYKSDTPVKGGREGRGLGTNGLRLNISEELVASRVSEQKLPVSLGLVRYGRALVFSWAQSLARRSLQGVRPQCECCCGSKSVAAGGCPPPVLIIEGSLERSEWCTPCLHAVHQTFKIGSCTCFRKYSQLTPKSIKKLSLSHSVWIEKQNFCEKPVKEIYILQINIFRNLT